MNNKEENSEDFCLDFVQEFGLCSETGNKVVKITISIYIQAKPRYKGISDLV